MLGQGKWQGRGEHCTIILHNRVAACQTPRRLAPGACCVLGDQLKDLLTVVAEEDPII